MRNIMFIALLLFLIPVAVSAEETKEVRKPKKPDRVVLEKNPNWSGQVTAYSLPGSVEIRLMRDTVIIAPYGGIENDTNIFVIWYDPSGNITTYAVIAGKGLDASLEIRSDKNHGVFFLSGLFTDTAHAGDKLLVSAGGTDAFIACFDKSGYCLWARSSGHAGDDYGKRAYFDKDSNIVMVGLYEVILGDSISFGDMQATAYKTGTNVFEPSYRLTDGALVPDEKGIFTKKENKQ